MIRSVSQRCIVLPPATVIRKIRVIRVLFKEGTTWVHDTDKLHKHADPYTAIHPKSWQRCTEAEAEGNGSIEHKDARPYALRKKVII